ncbi:FAD-dependent monooxygenase [Saccharothrix australiensis]|uniref:2-polyprenyl-6-methoxyphenol hydroxylase-like FAD-dependent oxidoreductase n=1 Tax=Saccharothrix australiensis TaxID=2072 RepID=A0A495W8F4_9PSEU|nr:FAD-dependent monooxygenase [Saccharothrix australiensis]RKT57982.1 2-polyprenyl-6-methoxyphenol hydroxylase-like FAD-dependent oxidoreductase [Saccharothrix australiensis]
MRAAVIGGGVGGLAAAIGLHQSGWAVTVHERAASLPATGTGLGIWRDAIEALDRLGLGATARQVGRRQPEGALRRPDGSRIGPLRADVHLLTRPALLALLAEALPEGAIRFGSTARWQDCDHDLVVAADGIDSATRRSLFGVEVRRSGSIGWRGTADVEVAAGGETWGRGVKFGLTPQADGRTNWYALTGPDADVHEVFRDWHDPIPRVLAGSAEVLRHSLDYLPPLPTYHQGRVVLLGDAAHAMTPDLGQGACQAIIDGVSLVECLNTHDLPAGLVAYDALRRRKTQRMVRQSLALNRLARARRFTGVRNAVLKAALALQPRRESWSADLEPDESAG